MNIFSPNKLIHASLCAGAFVFQGVYVCAMPTTKEATYENISKLVTQNLKADVNIHTHKEPSQTVKLVLSAESDDNLDKVWTSWKVSDRSGVLTINDTSSGFGGANFSGNGMMVISGAIVINGVDVTSQFASGGAAAHKELPKLKIDMPESTALKLGVTAGQCNIGDIAAPFGFRIRGSAVVCAQTIHGDVDANISGPGDFSAEKIVGNHLDASVSGSGDISIEDIEAKHASVKVSSSGDVRLGRGSVERIDASTSGSGDISIEDIEAKHASVKVSSSGDVRLGRGSVERIDASTSGSGDMKFDVCANSAKLTVSGSGDIYVKEVTGDVQHTASGSGKIKVGNRPDIKKDRASAGQGSSIIISGNGISIRSKL